MKWGAAKVFHRGLTEEVGFKTCFEKLSAKESQGFWRRRAAGGKNDNDICDSFTKQEKTRKPSPVAIGVSSNQLGVKLAVGWSRPNFFQYQKTTKGKKKNVMTITVFIPKPTKLIFFSYRQRMYLWITSQHFMIPNVHIQTEQTHLSGTWGKRSQPELHQTVTNPCPWPSVPQDDLCRTESQYHFHKLTCSSQILSLPPKYITVPLHL